MSLRKRSTSLAGHATSLALEPEFWAVLERMAAERSVSLAALLAELDAGRGADPLASACRVAALRWAAARGAGPAEAQFNPDQISPASGLDGSA